MDPAKPRQRVDHQRRAIERRPESLDNPDNNEDPVGGSGTDQFRDLGAVQRHGCIEVARIKISPRTGPASNDSTESDALRVAADERLREQREPHPESRIRRSGPRPWRRSRRHRRGPTRLGRRRRVSSADQAQERSVPEVQGRRLERVDDEHLRRLLDGGCAASGGHRRGSARRRPLPASRYSVQIDLDRAAEDVDPLLAGVRRGLAYTPGLSVSSTDCSQRSAGSDSDCSEVARRPRSCVGRAAGDIYRALLRGLADELADRDTQSPGQLQEQPYGRRSRSILETREVPDRDSGELRELGQRQVASQPVSTDPCGDALIVVERLDFCRQPRPRSTRAPSSRQCTARLVVCRSATRVVKSGNHAKGQTSTHDQRNRRPGRRRHRGGRKGGLRRRDRGDLRPRQPGPRRLRPTGLRRRRRDRPRRPTAKRRVASPLSRARPREGSSPLSDRLSMFWGDWRAVRTGEGEHFRRGRSTAWTSSSPESC